jgi:thiosulfate dehydrogenase
MRRPGTTAIVAGGLLAVSVLYCGAIFVGMKVKDLSGLSELPSFSTEVALLRKPAWKPPSLATIPNGAHGDSIRMGMQIFNETPLYAAQYARARISCTSCHAEGGIQPYASPMVETPAAFPQFNARSGHVISLKDRIQECFVRSENGKPLEYNGATMLAVVDYIGWLSTPEPERKRYVGRGLVALKDLTPDPVRGQQIYAVQCAGCHGQNGEGRPNEFPPLWGPNSFNDGAGMNGVKKMAAFVKMNMPQNRMGMLTAQEAYDVSAFIHLQPRPAFDKAYAHY